MLRPLLLFPLRYLFQYIIASMSSMQPLATSPVRISFLPLSNELVHWPSRAIFLSSILALPSASYYMVQWYSSLHNSHDWLCDDCFLLDLSSFVNIYFSFGMNFFNRRFYFDYFWKYISLDCFSVLEIPMDWNIRHTAQCNVAPRNERKVALSAKIFIIVISFSVFFKAV